MSLAWRHPDCWRILLPPGSALSSSWGKLEDSQLIIAAYKHNLDVEKVAGDDAFAFKKVAVDADGNVTMDFKDRYGYMMNLYMFKGKFNEEYGYKAANLKIVTHLQEKIGEKSTEKIEEDIEMVELSDDETYDDQVNEKNEEQSVKDQDSLDDLIDEMKAKGEWDENCDLDSSVDDKVNDKKDDHSISEDLSDKCDEIVVEHSVIEQVEFSNNDEGKEVKSPKNDEEKGVESSKNDEEKGVESPKNDDEKRVESTKNGHEIEDESSKNEGKKNDSTDTENSGCNIKESEESKIIEAVDNTAESQDFINVVDDISEESTTAESTEIDQTNDAATHKSSEMNKGEDVSKERVSKTLKRGKGRGRGRGN